MLLNSGKCSHVCIDFPEMNCDTMTRSRLDRLGLGWVNFSGSHSELTQDDVKINFTNSGSLESLP